MMRSCLGLIVVGLEDEGVIGRLADLRGPQCSDEFGPCFGGFDGLDKHCQNIGGNADCRSGNPDTSLQQRPKLVGKLVGLCEGFIIGNRH